MFKILFVLSVFFNSMIALGQSVAMPHEKDQLLVDASPSLTVDVVSEEHKAPEFINKTEPDYTSQDFLAKMMSMLTALYMGMWVLGEALTRVSVWTENKWDNKAAERVAQITWFIGAFAGRMGWKLPKLVIEHEAEKIAAKKMAAVSDKDKPKV